MARSDIRRTLRFYDARGNARAVKMRSTAPGVWRTMDGYQFQHHGHAWLGLAGQRYRIEKWSAPHTDRTFGTLLSAVRDWLNHTDKLVEKAG